MLPGVEGAPGGAGEEVVCTTHVRIAAPCTLTHPQAGCTQPIVRRTGSTRGIFPPGFLRLEGFLRASGGPVTGGAGGGAARAVRTAGVACMRAVTGSGRDRRNLLCILGDCPEGLLLGGIVPKAWISSSEDIVILETEGCVGVQDGTTTGACIVPTPLALELLSVLLIFLKL